MLGQSQDFVPLVLVGEEAATLERRHAAMTAGAFDYFQLPAELDLLILSATQLIKLHQTMDRLRGEADLDHLTGLANRRRFRVALSREVERWRHSEATSICQTGQMIKIRFAAQPVHPLMQFDQLNRTQN